MPTDETPPLAADATIAEANAANILAKLRAGKVLTRAEKKELAEYQAAEGERAAAAAAPADQRVADSMKAAAAMTGLTEERIGAAKDAGCPAFRGSRIHVGELLTWLEQKGDTLPTGDAELDRINKQIALEKLRAARFNNDVAEGRYMRREDFAAQILALGLELKTVLRKKLEDEFPDQQTMRSRDEILAVNRRLVDELCALFQEGTAQWSRK